MARKRRLWAVTVEVTLTETVYVIARSATTAAARAVTEDGWREALADRDAIDLAYHHGKLTAVGTRMVEGVTFGGGT